MDAALNSKQWRHGGFERLTVDDGFECQIVDHRSDFQTVNDDFERQTIMWL